ncbi:hypothetical protein E2C01_065510 [Portunus trituberculatus]|uniref:SGNH hydrolase-type esterase domain-containing protein n=1 Tax=Portunus trituberculatus TaxID=210409 RepID=A0A5B7HRA4_PORTR|nr:hypothetical protein [Portunus trituberculatus]
MRKEFRGRISDLPAEFCRVNLAPEGVAVPAVSLPSNETQGQEEWRLMSTGVENRKVLRALQRVETTNFFAVLEDVEEEREKAGGDEMRMADDSLPAGKIMVVGDSRVRHLDSAFCAEDRKRSTRVCLPGAGSERISAQVDKRLADGTKPTVFLSAGANDLCKIRSEELFRRLPGAGSERISAQLDKRLADGTKPTVFLSAGWMDGFNLGASTSEVIWRRYKKKARFSPQKTKNIMALGQALWPKDL